MIYSILIPTYKRNHDLCRCLDGLSYLFNFESSLSKNDFVVELVISDDACDDDLYNLIHREYPWAKIFHGPSKGPAANRNNAASKAIGEWLLFIDDDCIPMPGWVEGFHKCITEASVLEGKTIADRPQERLDEESPMNENGGFLWSCNFAIKKSLFDEIGGFDEGFPFAAMEDVDLRERLRAKNEIIYFTADAVVVHPWRKSKGIDFNSARQKSYLYFLNKHPTNRPESMSKYYFILALRGFIKNSLINGFKFRGKGFLFSVANDFWFLFQSIKFLFIKK